LVRHSHVGFTELATRLQNLEWRPQLLDGYCAFTRAFSTVMRLLG
jgi:hypothetical protein